jgi:hypothetical protein
MDEEILGVTFLLKKKIAFCYQFPKITLIVSIFLFKFIRKCSLKKRKIGVSHPILLPLYSFIFDFNEIASIVYSHPVYGAGV